jgi:hypothetical protein
MNQFVDKTRKTSLGPALKLRQVPKAVSANFSAFLGFIRWHRHTARPALTRPRRECLEVGLPEAAGRKEYYLASASPQ